MLRFLRRVFRALSRGMTNAGFPGTAAGNPFDQVARDIPAQYAPTPKK